MHTVKVVGKTTRKSYQVSHTEIYFLLVYTLLAWKVKKQKEKSTKELKRKYSRHHGIGTTSEVMARVLNTSHPVRPHKISDPNLNPLLHP